MFVPVSCTNCGKPFQVPEAALGKLAPCPWCQTAVTALPVSAPLPEPEAPPPPPAPAPAQEPPKPAQEPLSLDDPPPPPKAKPAPAPLSANAPVAVSISAPAAPPRSRWRFHLPTLLIGGGLVVVVMAATLLARGYGSGRMSDVGWSEFTPEDGSFTVALPGTPTEEAIGPNPDGSVNGGKRWSVRGWYSKATVWIAYADLTPALAQKLPSDKGRVIAAGVLRVERDREVTRLKATIAKEAEVREGAGWGIELHMDTPRGTVIERLVLLGDGPRPRLYVYGVEGKNLTTTSPAWVKLFGTFQVNNGE